MPFHLPSSSPAPSTPERRSSRFVFDADHPSTTPAGPPPPSSAPSFTPAGDPSPSYLQSSIGVMTGKIKAPNFGKPSASNNRSPSVKGPKVPLGRSIRSSTRGSTTRQPSSLSRQYFADDDDEEEEEEEDAEGELELPASRPGTFGISYEEDSEGDETEYGNDTIHADHDDDEDAEGEEEEEEQYEEDEAMEEGGDYDVEEDLLREIASVEPYGGDLNDDDDVMMLATPAADERIRREADDIFRASSMRSTLGRRRDYKFAALAKDLTTDVDFAQVSEPANVILQTEDLVNRLYDEGVGPEDDAEKLDSTLSAACVRLINQVWQPHVQTLPAPYEDHAAKVGPSAQAPDFEKATYLASLILRLYHTPPVQTEFGGSKHQALPAVLLQWQEDEHNLDGDQIESIIKHRPGPASHALFWQGVFSSLVRGNLGNAIQLLRSAGWANVKKSPRGELLYGAHAVENIERVVEDLCQVVELCPAIGDESWDIRSSDWTLFRLKAKAAKEALINFAEGKAPSQPRYNPFSNSEFADSATSQQSLAGLARKAQSQIPWDVYENLQSLYAILIGEQDAILAAAQDWCEAAIGLFSWWDDGHSKRPVARSHSRSVNQPGESPIDDVFLDRLALSLQTATECDFHFDSADAIEVGVASAFEGNIDGVIGILRTFSLPIAATVAEIASLGRWLPPQESQNLIGMESFDMEDMEVLGLNRSTGLDDKDGLKDTTLIHYARGLRDRKHVSGVGINGKVSRDGWELAVQVVGRLDSPERSEDVVRELLQGVLATIDESSHATVDKIWKLLNELGMINFAEDTAETFGDILARDTHRFGQTLWYYALAHRPDKLRDVLNTLMSISLVESTTYPPEAQLDDDLRRLLKERATTLEQFAKQDLEAAELLGKMLSGYATLRRFYECRDGDSKTNQKSLPRRQQAAGALIAVIASADDNIRGGLYDDSRDAVVSEDFLLALLGEASVFIGEGGKVITLEQIDVLLKAIEDIQTVGSRVYDAADEFFKLVLSSGQGLKGSTPGDLMRKSTGSLGGSFMMTGSSMMASQFKQSVVKSGMMKGPVKRSWDWRTGILANSNSADVLKKIRLGLTKDLANLWLEQADSIVL